MSKGDMIFIVFLVLVVLGIGIAVTAHQAARIIQPGFVGVSVLLGGARDKGLEEGLNFVVPYLTSVHLMNIQIQKVEVGGNEAASRDLQVVRSTIVVNYRLERDKVVDLFRSIGKTYETTVIIPSVEEVFKAVTAHFAAEELITQRAVVSVRMQESLAQRLGPHGIAITQVNITGFDFSPEYNSAIEAKVVAEQAALRAENELRRIEIEAQQVEARAKGEAAAVIAKAEAEAESMRLRLEYAKPELAIWEGIQKWSGAVPSTVMIGGSTPTPVFDVLR